MIFLLHWFNVGVAYLSLAPPPTAAFSRGASPASCREMTPNHIRAHPQDPGHSHVTVLTSASSYRPGQLLTVTVRSSRDFMGFLLQARGVGDRPVGGDPVLLGGRWALTPPGAHTLRCLSDDDTVTHSDKQLKRNLSFVWRAPDAPAGDLRFHITVVQSYFVYWASIESAVLHDGSAMDRVKVALSIPVPQDSGDDQKEATERSSTGRSTRPLDVYSSTKSLREVAGVTSEEKNSSSLKTFRKSTLRWTEERRTHRHTVDPPSFLPITTSPQVSALSFTSAPPSPREWTGPNLKSPAPLIGPQEEPRTTRLEITTEETPSTRHKPRQMHRTEGRFRSPGDLIQDLEGLISLTGSQTSPPRSFLLEKSSSPNPVLPSGATAPPEVGPLSSQSISPVTSLSQTLLIPPVPPDTSTAQTSVKVTRREQSHRGKPPPAAGTFPQWTELLPSATPEGEGQHDLMFPTGSETTILAAASISSSSTSPSMHPTNLEHSSLSSATNQPHTAAVPVKLPTPSPIAVPDQRPSVQNPPPSLASTVPDQRPSVQNFPPSLASTVPSVTSSKRLSGLPSRISSSTSPVSPFTSFQSASASSLLSVSSSTSPVPPAEDHPRPSPAPRRSLNAAPTTSSVSLRHGKPAVSQSRMIHHVSTSDPKPKETTSRPAVHPNPKPHPNLKLSPGHEVKPNHPNSKTKPPAETPGGKEGKHPDIVPRHSDWELGMLLGCSAGLGMALVVAVRYVYRQACGKRTQVTLNDRERQYTRGDRGLIHVQECGDLVRVRKIRENSFVLLAEYDILATPAD